MRYHDTSSNSRLDVEDVLGFTPSGPLDRPIALTVFPNRTGAKAIPLQRSFRQLVETIRETNAPEKAGLPLLKLGRFGGERTASGSLRTNANLLAVTGVEIDYDGGAVTLAEAVAAAKKAGIAALVYSSPSSTPEKSRWRMLALTSREMPPGERRGLVAMLNGVLGGIVAPESFTPSQSFYYGGVGGRAPEVALVDGAYLDLAGDMPRIFPAGAEREQAASSGRKTGLTPDQFAEAVRAVRNDHRFEDYGEWLRFLMAIYAETDGSEEGFALADEFYQKDASYDPDLTREKWDSFAGGVRDVTGDTVLFFARQDDWRDPPIDPMAEFEDLGEEEPEQEVDKEEPSSAGLRFSTPDECDALPQRGYVWKGVVAPGDLGVIIGAPGVGKSLAAPLVGYMVAKGDSAFGLRTRVGTVFYVAAEDPHGMAERVRALRQQHGPANNFLLVTGLGVLIDNKGNRTAAFKELRQAVKLRRPALIIFDTLAMTFPGLDENDAAAMGRVVSVGRKLNEFGAAVLFVHHTAKQSDGTPRGHSVLNGALDVSLELLPEGGGVVRGRLRKNRNGSLDKDIAFTIRTVDLGKDDDGDPRAAAYAKEMSDMGEPRKIKPSPVEGRAFAVLLRLAEEEGRTLANGEKGVDENRWRTVCVDGRDVSTSEKKESRDRIVRNAIQGLKSKSLIGFAEGCFYAASTVPPMFDNLEDDAE